MQEAEEDCGECASMALRPVHSLHGRSMLRPFCNAACPEMPGAPYAGLRVGILAPLRSDLRNKYQHTRNDETEEASPRLESKDCRRSFQLGKEQTSAAGTIEQARGNMNSTKKTARIAGLLYLVNGLTGFFSIIYVPNKLIVSGDAAATPTTSSRPRGFSGSASLPN